MRSNFFYYFIYFMLFFLLRIFFFKYFQKKKKTHTHLENMRDKGDTIIQGHLQKIEAPVVDLCFKNTRRLKGCAIFFPPSFFLFAKQNKKKTINFKCPNELFFTVFSPQTKTQKKNCFVFFFTLSWRLKEMD